MAVKKTIIIDVQSNEANKKVDNLKNSLKDVNKEAKKTSESVDDVAGNGGAIAILDQLTGGLATRFKDAYEASKLFNVSLKATKGALLATGIGAFVVILGTVLAYWDDIEEFINGSNKKLQEQIDLSIRNQKATKLNLDLLEKQISLNDKLGKGNELLQSQRLEVLKILLKQNKEEITGLQLQNERLKSAAFELTTREKILKTVLNTFRAGTGDAFILEQQLESSLKYKDNLDLITKAKTDQVDLEIKLFDLQNPKNGDVKKEDIDSDKIERDRLKALSDYEKQLRESDEDLFDTTEAEKIERQRQRAQEQLDSLIATETEKREAQILLTEYYDELEFQNQILLDEKKREQDEKEKADQEKRDKEAAEKKIQAEKTVAKTLDDIQDAQINNIAAGVQLLASLGERNKALQAGAIIASNAAGIAKTIITTQASNAATIAEGAALAIPSGGASVAAASALVAANKVAAGISIATSIAATARGLSQLGKGGGGGSSSSSGGSSGGGASAPSFNLVQGSGTNQIAESINSSGNRPIQAYVVSGSVTSAQELDRNIVESSTI